MVKALADYAQKSGHYAMLLCFLLLAFYALGWVLLFCSINMLIILEFN